MNRIRYIFSNILLLLTVVSFSLMADSTDVFNNYNMQPEVWHPVGYPKGQVDNKGDLSLSIPILTVPGRGGLDYEVKFNYNAPIKKNQMATWVGLGWSFDPGSITRDPKGSIREPDSSTATGVDYTKEVGNQPDSYFLTLPGQGTSEFSRSNDPDFYQTFLSTFDYEPTNDLNFYFHLWKPWKIDTEIENGSTFSVDGWSVIDHDTAYVDEFRRFIITTDNGTRYVFGVPTLAAYTTQYWGAGTLYDYYASVWRIEAILSPECPDDVVVPDEYTSGNWIKFEYRFDENNTYKSLFLDGRFIQNTYLHKIITPTHFAEFTTSVRHDNGMDPLENNIHCKLDSIKLYKNGENDPLQTVALNLTKLLVPGGDNGGKTTLEAIEFFGRNDNPQPGFVFEYDTLHNPSWTDINLKNWYDDDYGYYDDGQQNWAFDSNKDDADAWSIKTIYYPTGGSETFEYENDAIFENFAGRHDAYVKFWVYDSDTLNTNGLTYYEYDFEIPEGTRLHQGGTRVTKITRRDAQGNEQIDSYTYGHGIPTGIPPAFLTNSYQQNVYHVPGNRGSSAIVYDWVQRFNSSGTFEINYYSVPSVVLDTVHSEYFKIVTANIDPTYYIYQGPYGSTTVNTNEDILWGHNYKTHTFNIGHDIVTEKIYSSLGSAQYQVMSDVAPIPVLEHGTWVMWFNPLVDTTITTENGVTRTRIFEYDNGPKYVSRTTQLGSQGEKRVTETVYGFEIPEYGGSRSNPAGLRLENNLKKQAYTATYSESPSSNKTWYSSQLNRWKEVDFPGDGSNYQRFKKADEYRWLKNSPQSSAPDTNGVWDVTQSPGSDWQLSFTYDTYDDYGQLLALTDGRGNSTNLYYGDNNNNFSNSTDGLQHAYLTGVERGDLTLSYDYDAASGLPTTMTDANGNTTRFYYDDHGRLVSTVGPEGFVNSEQAYFLSGDTSGSQLSFVETVSYPNGNYIQNGSFEINSPDNSADFWLKGVYDIITESDDSPLGHSVMRLPASGTSYHSKQTPIEAGKEYIISLRTRRESGSGHYIRFYLADLWGTEIEVLAYSLGQEVSTSTVPVVGGGYSHDNWKTVWLKFRSLVDDSTQLRITNQGGSILIDDVIFAPLLTEVQTSVFPSDIEPRVTVDYYNGISQKVQTVQSAGPYRDANKIISHSEYDPAGRVWRQYKPYQLTDDTTAVSALTSYIADAADSNSSRSAFAFYDGTAGADAAGFPYTEFIYGVNKDYARYTFSPGEIYHLPEGSDPYAYPAISPLNNTYYTTKLVLANLASDISGYSADVLQKFAVVDEGRRYSTSFVDRLGNEIRRVDYQEGSGQVRMNTQSFADSLSFPFDIKKFSFTATVDETIHVDWKSTFSKLTGKNFLRIGTANGSGNIASLVDSFNTSGQYQTIDTTITLSVTAGNTYYFQVSSEFISSSGGSGNRSFNGNFQHMQMVDEGDAGASNDTVVQTERKADIGGGQIESDKYVTSFVDLNVTQLSIEYYTPTHTTGFEYDGAGNLVKVQPPNYFSPPNGSSASDWEIEYYYNTLNQLTKSTSPDAGTTEQKYDVAGNLRFSQDANRKNAGEVMFTRYDFANRPMVTGIVNQNFASLVGSASYAFEDSTAYWISATQFDSVPDFNSFPWNQNAVLASYADSLENLATRLTADAFRIDEDGSADTLQLFDQTLSGSSLYTGRLGIESGSLTIQSGADIVFQAGQSIILQDGFVAQSGSNLHAKIDTELIETAPQESVWQYQLYSYDGLGRNVKKFIVTDGLPVLTRHFVFNGQGQIAEVHDTYGSHRFSHFQEFDGFGRLSKVLTSRNGEKPQLADAEYTYNGSGLMSQVGMSEVSGGNFAIDLGYRYNIRDWITSIDSVESPSTPFAAEYTFTPDGQIDAADFYNINSDDQQDRFRYQYSYDHRKQLTAADYEHLVSGNWTNPDRYDVSQLAYDKNGNILSLLRNRENDTVVDNLDYQYGTNNRLLSVSDSIAATSEDWDAENTAFSYDSSGNVTRIVEGGVSKIDSIHYDYRNLPIQMLMGDGRIITYRYNAAGQRVYKRIKTGGAVNEEHYLMDGDQNLAVVEDGNIDYWNIFGNTLIGRSRSDSSRVFYLKDHLGSTRATVDTAGYALENHDYYPFGLQMPGRSSFSGQRTKELFTGKERDLETGLDYFGARYYSALLGKFLSTDPHAYKYPSLTPYNYVGNNPIGFIDPNGMDSTKADQALQKIAPVAPSPPPPPAAPSKPSLSKYVKGILTRAVIYLSMLELFTADDPRTIQRDEGQKTENQDEDEGSVTIYKAPRPGMGNKLQQEGFKAEDFPAGNGLDGAAYFAGPNDRSLAEDFARQYGEGVLEVSIPKKRYEQDFQKFERPYLSGAAGQTELKIPNSEFSKLNTNPRTLKSE